MFGSEVDAISERLVEKLARREGTTPAELHPPLYEVVDLEALDAVFASLHGGTTRDASGRIEFEYEGYRVRVEDDETIVVDELEES